jgi:hypothetical protein
MTTFTIAGVGGAGEADHFGIAGFSSNELLAAMRNGSDDLELITFSYDDTKPPGQALARTRSATAGKVGEVALALIDRKAVTAVRAGDGHLLLISWNVPSGQASIDRLHDSGTAAGEASQIAMTTMFRTMLVTALKDGGGNLLIITWQLNPDGTFTRLGDSNKTIGGQAAGRADLVKVAPMGGDTVVTAVKDGSGNLELIAWRITAGGQRIERLTPRSTPAQAGHIDELSLVVDGANIVTAVRNGSDDLQVVNWRMIDGGFVRIGDTNALPPGKRPGRAEKISVCHLSDKIVTSLRQGSGALELIAFDIVGSGGFSRSGDLVYPQVSNPDETVIASVYNRIAVASKRANFLDLRLFTVTN